MNCTFHTSDGVNHVCTVCGKPLRTHFAHAPSQIVRICAGRPAGAASVARRRITEKLLAIRYVDADRSPNVPREEAFRRLAVCRTCEAHYLDSLGLDRCRRCDRGRCVAAVRFVLRLTGELPPVAACPWAAPFPTK